MEKGCGVWQCAIRPEPEWRKICARHGNGMERLQRRGIQKLNMPGTLYRDGIGTRQNYKEAAYWFRKAASNGHAKAMINIARQFAEGKGVLADQRIAAENYWRAAERGEDEGAYQFAVMLRDGKGVAKDLPRALKYFTKAAAHDYKDSRSQAEALISQGVRLSSEKKKR